MNHEIRVDGRLIGRPYDPHQWPPRRRYQRPLGYDDWFSAGISIGLAVVAGWIFGILQASTWIHR